MTHFVDILRDETTHKIDFLQDVAKTLCTDFDVSDISVNEVEFQIESPSHGVKIWFTKIPQTIDGITIQWHAVNNADNVEIVSTSIFEAFSDACILL